MDIHGAVGKSSLGKVVRFGLALAGVSLGGTARADQIWSVLEQTPASVYTRSLRGLALSSDGSVVYGGYIQGTGAGTQQVIGYNATTGAQTSATGQTIYGQPKGVATDDRGNVYMTLNSATNANTQPSAIYNAALDARLSTFTSTLGAGQQAQESGVDVVNIGGNYYEYIAFNKGNGTFSGVERINVNDPTNPFVDTTFGTNGFLNLKALTGNALAFVNGITVTSDGTIYAAGGLTAGTGANTYGDSLIRISSDLSSYSTVGVAGAMDVALYGGNAYVTQYGYHIAGSDNYSIAVVDLSSFTQTDTLTPTGIPARSSSTGTDSGLSGIAISSTGMLYVADQLAVGTGASNAGDRILMTQLTTAVPEPSSVALMGLGAVVLAGCRLGRRGRAE